MSGVLTLSTLTKRYVEVPVTSRDSTADPTGDVVKMAFMAPGVKPVPGDFVTGSWRVGTSGKFYARALVGPGAKVLIPGTYTIWLTFTDNPEIPTDPVGTLKIV